MDAPITSKTNARVKLLRAALEGRRRTGDPVAIEGPNLLAEALRSGVHISAVYVREDKLSAVSLPPSIPIHLLSRDVFASVSATEHSQGIAALLDPLHHTLPRKANCLVLVLAGLQDPGNMGTLIRSAEAFGSDAVITTAGTVDPWNQKSLRASAGSVFRMPVIEMDLVELKRRGFHLIAAVAREGTTPEQMPASGDRAILIGNEGAGLSPEQISLADSLVTIPCPGAVESLNAAIAGSLLLYAISRQRK